MQTDGGIAAQRAIVSDNLIKLREKRYPGHGGRKQIADAMGLKIQQWSPWERGNRTPDEMRLAEIAKFFGVTVAWMRQDQRPFSTRPSIEPSLAPPPGFSQDAFNTGSMGNTPPPFGFRRGRRHEYPAIANVGTCAARQCRQFFLACPAFYHDDGDARASP